MTSKDRTDLLEEARDALLPFAGRVFKDGVDDESSFPKSALREAQRVYRRLLEELRDTR